MLKTKILAIIFCFLLVTCKDKKTDTSQLFSDSTIREKRNSNAAIAGSDYVPDRVALLKSVAAKSLVTTKDTVTKIVNKDTLTIITSTVKTIDTIIRPYVSPTIPPIPKGNIALGKTVTVSSLEVPQFTGNLAVDGSLDIKSRWSSNNNNVNWLTVDLGNTFPIGRIKITWEAARGINYQIQTSNNNTTWSTIKSVTGNSVLVNDYTVKGSGRYVRMNGLTKNFPQYGYSIIEFEIYSDSGGVVVVPPVDTIPIPPPPPPPTTGINYLNLPLYPGSGGMAAGIGRVTGNNITISGYRFTNKGGTNNGHCLWVTGTNIIIENNFFDESEGLAIYVNTGSSVTIRNNVCANNNWGMLIQRTTGNVKIINNQFLNMIWDRQVQGCCRGQLIFYDGCSGSGNEATGNRGENFVGESYNEDLVNTFGSGGTVASPLLIKDNIFRGGGPSLTSGGIIGGDVGSSNVLITGNKLVNPGWYGFQFVSGTNLTFANNQVYSESFPWSRIGFLIYRIVGYPACSGITVGTSNWSNFKRESGSLFNFETDGTCGAITGPSTGQTLASMNVPNHLLTLLTEDQIWELRSRKVKYDRIVANGKAYGDYDLSRPNASATFSGNTLRSTSTATNSNTIVAYRWVQVSGPGTLTFSNATGATTTVSGSAGTYVVRQEVTQQNKGSVNVKTHHSNKTTITL